MTNHQLTNQCLNCLNFGSAREGASGSSIAMVYDGAFEPPPSSPVLVTASAWAKVGVSCIMGGSSVSSRAISSPSATAFPLGNAMEKSAEGEKSEGRTSGMICSRLSAEEMDVKGSTRGMFDLGENQGGILTRKAGTDFIRLGCDPGPTRTATIASLALFGFWGEEEETELPVVVSGVTRKARECTVEHEKSAGTGVGAWSRIRTAIKASSAWHPLGRGILMKGVP